MPDIPGFLAAHNRQVDSFVANFQRELQGITASAQASVTAELQAKLKVTNGKIDRTAANRRTLRKVGEMFRAAMNRAGYADLLEEFAAGFNGQLPAFDEMLQIIGAELGKPLQVKFDAADKAVFEYQQLSAVDSMGAVVGSIAESASREALMSIGALRLQDLVEEIARVFARTIPEATSIAETSTSMFFRMVNERGFAQIEKGLPAGQELRYSFRGPDDRLTRPFCDKLLDQTRTEPLSRSQIEALDNGQLPNPFITGGGFRCRHQWILQEIA